MRTFIPLIIVVCLIYGLQQPAFASDKDKKKGKLEQFEEELQDSTDSKKEIKKKKGKDSDDSDDSFGAKVALFMFKFFFRLMTYFPGENEALYNGKFFEVKYSRYPYVSKNEGLFTKAEGKNYSANLDCHYFHESSNLRGYSFNLRMSPHSLMNISYHFTEFYEDIDGETDRLGINDFYINYNRFRFPEFYFWWDLGTKWIRGDRSYEGMSFNYGLELYVLSPVSFYYNYKSSAIKSILISEHLAKINVHYNRAFGYVGYQRLFNGSNGIHGWVLGLGAYL